ncbi:MAG: hypothetical protein E7198_10800 [Schwartzia succinivorans]|uniref:hypothetical protein n=1 Tax=Schwartzia succinivorans TaxID=55507 RepID=UPI002355CF30|nr:hypothetical protein [Schwartzia succinivorans]MBE6098255.1 hypothetical protein [Schwartzia succinivorans]
MMNKAQIQNKINEYAAANNMQVVDFSDKKLSMKLDFYSCCKARTGKCSLDLKDEELNIYDADGLSCGYASKVNYCRSMLDAMKDPEKYDSLFNSPDNTMISKCSCGHYFVSGQHRICVAKHEGLAIPVNEITESPIECFSCVKQNDYKIS